MHIYGIAIKYLEGKIGQSTIFCNTILIYIQINHKVFV